VAVSKNRYGVEQTVDTHKKLINAIVIPPHEINFAYKADSALLADLETSCYILNVFILILILMQYVNDEL
jgi:hypothetical protein